MYIRARLYIPLYYTNITNYFYYYIDSTCYLSRSDAFSQNFIQRYCCTKYFTKKGKSRRTNATIITHYIQPLVVIEYQARHAIFCAVLTHFILMVRVKYHTRVICIIRIITDKITFYLRYYRNNDF